MNYYYCLLLCSSHSIMPLSQRFVILGTSIYFIAPIISAASWSYHTPVQVGPHSETGHTTLRYWSGLTQRQVIPHSGTGHTLLRDVLLGEGVLL